MSDTDPLDRLDYYALLQIPREATRDAVRAAFHRFASKYHPDKHTGDGASLSKVERAAHVYRRGAEAYKVLADPGRRRAYDAGLREGVLRFDPNAPVREDPAAVLAWPLKVQNPVARPFAVKAEQAFKAGDVGAAKVNLKMVASKDPGNPYAAAWLALLAERSSLRRPSDP
ncbi:MAG: hypothetical protein RL385_5674 [Pseudomonadota bacterium]|jgi:curved DNA-binding protein CbpA